MGRAVKLQDFFTNRKVPQERRHELLLGVTGSGEIFWVEGERIGERFKVTPDTRRILQWNWQRG
jgi:tRNA(Ile)-lysidine synthase